MTRRAAQGGEPNVGAAEVVVVQGQPVKRGEKATHERGKSLHGAASRVHCRRVQGFYVRDNLIDGNVGGKGRVGVLLLSEPGGGFPLALVGLRTVLGSCVEGAGAAARGRGHRSPARQQLSPPGLRAQHAAEGGGVVVRVVESADGAFGAVCRGVPQDVQGVWVVHQHTQGAPGGGYHRRLLLWLLAGLVFLNRGRVELK
mmetsp:Transcript_13164/g.39833  ORF Transcript_13164/g.39833 Transcript_13164/m.39833 type:complete len:200 (+) Transcript_13164:1192-1791(+)